MVGASHPVEASGLAVQHERPRGSILLQADGVDRLPLCDVYDAPMAAANEYDVEEVRRLRIRGAAGRLVEAHSPLNGESMLLDCAA